MKRFLTTILVLLFAMPLMAQDPDAAIVIGEPGYYGHLHDIDHYGKPKLIYAEPVIVQRVANPGAPIYVHVPPGHYQHWDQHCSRYDACGRQVYFVDHDWYETTFVPAYQKQHPGKHQGQPKIKDKSNYQSNSQGKAKGNDQGSGKDNSQGNSKGKDKDNG